MRDLINMKVQDVMVKDVKFCSPNTNLAAAAEMLWTDCCGTLPVVDDRGNVIGIITDRDMCIAIGTRDVKPSSTTVRDVSLPKLFACAPDDDIHAALQTMAAQKIRRLPVIDKRGTLKGILSIDDVVLHAVKTSTRFSDLTYENVVNTLKAICERPLEPAAVALAHA